MELALATARTRIVLGRTHLPKMSQRVAVAHLSSTAHHLRRQSTCPPSSFDEEQVDLLFAFHSSELQAAELMAACFVLLRDPLDASIPAVGQEVAVGHEVRRQHRSSQQL